MFLSLPVEVRSLILEQALIAQHEPPASPSKENRVVYQDIDYRAWKHRAYSQDRSTHRPPNCLALLLTCHQISAETKAILSLRKAHLHEYHLDISVLNEEEVYPTWTCVPQLTTHVVTLNADIRLFGHILSTASTRYQTHNGRFAFEWPLYAILERFLQYGAVGDKQQDIRMQDENTGMRQLRSRYRKTDFIDRGITVDMLILDVSSAETQYPLPPREVDFEDWDAWHDNGGIGKLDRYASRPEWIARYLKEYIDMLLKPDTAFTEFGSIMHDRIGSIVIVIDGEVQYEFELNP
ncbi:hypothetical protein BDV18DRAFT_157541 [Aspergillus unguis]